MKRYFDSFAPSMHARKGILKETYGTKPFSLSVSRLHNVTESGIARALDPSNTRTMSIPIEAYQYGPSTIYNVPPGEMVIIRDMQEQDVIGSSHFTSCSALTAQKNDDFFFAHIRMSNPLVIRDLYSKLSSEFGKDNYNLISPQKLTELPEEPKGDHKAIQQFYAKNPQIGKHRFPYISTSSLNPYNIESTSVLVGPKIKRTIGMRFETEK